MVSLVRDFSELNHQLRCSYSILANVKKTLNWMIGKILYLWFEVVWPPVTPKILNRGKFSSHVVTANLLLHAVSRFQLWLVLSGQKGKVTWNRSYQSCKVHSVFSHSMRLTSNAFTWLANLQSITPRWLREISLTLCFRKQTFHLFVASYKKLFSTSAVTDLTMMLAFCINDYFEGSAHTSFFFWRRGGGGAYLINEKEES